MMKVAAWCIGSTFSVASVVCGALLGGQRGALAALTLLGTVLTIGGLIWGAVELRNEHRRLKWGFRGIGIINASQMPDDEKTRRKEMTMPRSSTWGDVEYLRELIRLHVVEQAAENLGLPLALTLLGVLCSTVAGTWSLWL